jgi:hypothetical protein
MTNIAAQSSALPAAAIIDRSHTCAASVSQDGAEIVNGVDDRVREEMFRRIGIEDLLSPRVPV